MTTKGVITVDTLRIYLLQIQNAPLLTRVEELQLCRLINTDTSEMTGLVLSESLARATDARDKMTHANLPLVVNIAATYRGSKIDFSDLIGEGNLGLLRAVEGFDESHDCGFATYATWWIRSAIRRFCIRSGTIKKSTHTNEQMVKWNTMAIKLGPDASGEDVRIALGYSQKKADAISQHRLAKQVASASTTEWKNFVSEDSGRQDVITRETLDIVVEAMGELKPNERRAMELHYPLDGSQELSYAEIGKEMGVSKQAVQQMIGRVTETLKRISTNR